MREYNSALGIQSRIWKKKRNNYFFFFFQLNVLNYVLCAIARILNWVFEGCLHSTTRGRIIDVAPAEVRFVQQAIAVQKANERKYEASVV